MSKEHNDLAVTIWLEHAANDPNGEVDRRAVEAEVRRRLVMDIDKLKDVTAKAATQAAYDRLTRPTMRSLPLPGLAPEPDVFIPYEPDRAVEAPRAKLRHIVGATQLRQENVNEVNVAFAAWQAATLPLYVYFAQGMTWDEAAVAFRRDHPEAQAADD